MAINYGSWYRDSANKAIDAKLALAGAGAGGEAVSRLAKIPLDIDDRAMKQQALDSASSAANSRLSVAEINAKAKVIAAQLGLKGREVTAFARQYVADAGRANNINSNKTARDGYEYGVIKETIKGANQKDVAKINKSTKSPTQEEYFYDDDGNKVKKVNRSYVPPIDFTIDALDEVAKKVKKS